MPPIFVEKILSINCILLGLSVSIWFRGTLRRGLVQTMVSSDIPCRSPHDTVVLANVVAFDSGGAAIDSTADICWSGPWLNGR